MSFVEGIASTSLDLADPGVMLSVCIAVIFVCALLDAPAIARTLRVYRRKWRLARLSRKWSADSRSMS